MTQALQGVRAPDRPCVDGLDRPARIQRLAVPRKAAFWLVAYVFGVTILGTSLPAPLYAIYQRQWHFSAGVLTLVFAAYAVAVLVTLLVAGRASDQVGRKPVMAAALGFSTVSTIVFILAPSVGWLYLGRVLSGLSAGLMTGAAPAALTEMLQESESRRSSMVATAANMSGAGLGPLMAGLFAEYLPQPTVLVFEVYLGLLVIAGLAVASAARDRDEQAAAEPPVQRPGPPPGRAGASSSPPGWPRSPPSRSPGCSPRSRPASWAACCTRRTTPSRAPCRS